MFEMDIENFSLLGHPSHHLARLRQPILSPHFLLCTIMGFMGDSLSDLVLCIVCCAQLLIASRYTPWMGGRRCASQHPVSVHFHVRSAPSHASWFWKNCLMGGGRRRLHGLSLCGVLLRSMCCFQLLIAVMMHRVVVADAPPSTPCHCTAVPPVISSDLRITRVAPGLPEVQGGEDCRRLLLQGSLLTSSDKHEDACCDDNFLLRSISIHALLSHHLNHVERQHGRIA